MYFRIVRFSINIHYRHYHDLRVCQVFFYKLPYIVMVIDIMYHFSFHNNLCLGLNHDHDLVMMRKELGNDTQLWKWQEGNSFINKAGLAMDVKGSCSEPGKFNNDKS